MADAAPRPSALPPRTTCLKGLSKMIDEQWNRQRCQTIAEQHLSGLGDRWAHAAAVGELGEQLTRAGLLANHIACAAWLHDIGYAAALNSTGCHAVDGAEYLARSGAPRRIGALVAHHTGAQWEAEQRSLTLDLIRGPQDQSTDPRTRVAEILNRYPPDHPVHRAVVRSQRHLLAPADRAQAILGPDLRSGCTPCPRARRADKARTRSECYGTVEDLDSSAAPAWLATEIRTGVRWPGCALRPRERHGG